jgi:hypothetical protein
MNSWIKCGISLFALFSGNPLFLFGWMLVCCVISKDEDENNEKDRWEARAEEDMP